jgi:hypothetical protein
MRDYGAVACAMPLGQDERVRVLDQLDGAGYGDTFTVTMIALASARYKIPYPETPSSPGSKTQHAACGRRDRLRVH